MIKANRHRTPATDAILDAKSGMLSQGEHMTAMVGDMAPEFSLPGTTGPGLDLAQIRGKGRAALFFYPADRTSG
jgi:hypothetical protein